MVNACLDAHSLSEYIAGKTLPAAVEEIEAHLRACRNCQARAAQYSPTSDSLCAAIRRSAAGVDVSESHEPELAAALAAIAAQPPKVAAETKPPTDGDTGRLIRDYQLRRKLGEGGMGAVYLAIHTRLKKPVAIKLLKAERNHDAQAIARFAIEMEAVGKLEHPHIVRALDAGEEAGIQFLVMEYLAGIDVARLARGLGRIHLPDACEIVRQAALGLHHAHENDVIHRDVKPSNIMLLQSGKVKVLDLGLAHFRPALHHSASLTGDNQVLGTLLYVAPEQMLPGGSVDARTDIYSLGVTLCELLLGGVPLKQGLHLPRLLPEDLASRPEVPPAIWRLAQRMTAHNRDERPSSMLEVAEELRPWTSGANLVAVLQQVAGQTSMAGEQQPGFPPGQLTPGGQWISQAAPASSSWGAIDVVPPPISATLLAPPIAAATSPRAANRLSSFFDNTHPAGLWSIAGGLATLACILAVAIGVNWPSLAGPAGGAGSDTAPTDVGWVRISDRRNEGLWKSLLDGGNVKVVHQHTGAATTLATGENKLPPGQYAIDWKAPDWNPDLRLLADSFSVVRGEHAELTPSLDYFPWRLPQIPRGTGQSCEYDGRLWHPEMGASPTDSSRSFHARLTILGPADAAAPSQQWLSVEVHDHGGDYRETALLLIDREAWQASQRLNVLDGYLTATSALITDALADDVGQDRIPQLVARFNTDQDTLSDAAAAVGPLLPSPRIGTHCILALLFGDAGRAAPQWVRQIRATMPADGRFSVEPLDVSRGVKLCLEVRAETPSHEPQPTSQSSPARVASNPTAPPAGTPTTQVVINVAGDDVAASALPPSAAKPGTSPHESAAGQWAGSAFSASTPGTKWYLARNETIPFSLVGIDVAGPQFVVKVTLANFNTGDNPSATALPPIELLRKAADWKPSARSPFDRASLPAADKVGVVFGGKLTRPAVDGASLVAAGFRAAVRTVRSEAVNGVPHRWLEVSVESSLERPTPQTVHEEALVLVNEAEYEQGDFVIARGWFLYKDYVFRFQPDGDMRAIDAALHYLGEPLHPSRLSVHEVMTLLFDARLAAALDFGKLRSAFAAEVGGPMRERSLTRGETLLPEGGTVPTDTWKWDADPQKPAAGPGYRIVRSRGRQIPFDFAEVMLHAPGGVTLATSLLRPQSSPREWESEALLGKGADATLEKAAAKAQALPNWRLWTVKDNPQRVWAEYGGKAGDTVLLRDKDSRISSRSRTELKGDGDQEAVDRGRVWHGRDGAALFRGELEKITGDRCEFARTDARGPAIRTRGDFHTVDRLLLEKLETLLAEARGAGTNRSAKPADYPFERALPNRGNSTPRRPTTKLK